MEIKQSKITRLIKSQTADSYGKWSFNLEFENGDRGYYNTKNGDQTFFVAGQVSDYMLEAKLSKAGSPYFVITHPEEKATAAVSGGGFKKPDPKVQIIGFAMSYTKDLIVAGKVPMEGLEKEFNRIHALMLSKL